MRKLHEKELEEGGKELGGRGDGGTLEGGRVGRGRVRGRVQDMRERGGRREGEIKKEGGLRTE